MIPLDQPSNASNSRLITERPVQQSLSGMRILIVDDEPSICSLLMDILREHGADASYTCEPSEALKLLNCASYDLVLSDLHMPGMDGIQLLDQINHLVPATAVVMLTGCSEVSTAVEAMRAGAFNYVTKPFDPQKVCDVVADAVRVAESRKQEALREEKRVAERSEAINHLQSQLADSSDQAIEALVAALDSREHETHNHSLRVAEYANCLAVALDLNEDRRLVLRRAAMLHDIGKIGIADEVLMKEDRLSAQEWELLRRHPQIGYEILQRVNTLVPPSGVVLAHHEKFDGSGYPRGLREEQIPLEARILTLADSLDAMTSDRPYRRALSFPEAVNEIQRVSGTQFDPVVVAAFHRIPLETWAKMRSRTLSVRSFGLHGPAAFGIDLSLLPAVAAPLGGALRPEPLPCSKQLLKPRQLPSSRSTRKSASFCGVKALSACSAGSRKKLLESLFRLFCRKPSRPDLNVHGLPEVTAKVSKP